MPIKDNLKIGDYFVIIASQVLLMIFGIRIIGWKIFGLIFVINAIGWLTNKAEEKINKEFNEEL